LKKKCPKILQIFSIETDFQALASITTAQENVMASTSLGHAYKQEENKVKITDEHMAAISVFLHDRKVKLAQKLQEINEDEQGLQFLLNHILNAYPAPATSVSVANAEKNTAKESNDQNRTQAKGGSGSTTTTPTNNVFNLRNTQIIKNYRINVGGDVGNVLCEYEGEVDNQGLPHGHGTLLATNFETSKELKGAKYIGEFVGGKVEGTGTLFYPNGSKLYEGECKGDKRHGKGILYNEDGSIWHDGMFENGEPSHPKY
jgi:hypothetical protein